MLCWDIFCEYLLSYVGMFCYDNLLFRELNFISMERNYYYEKTATKILFLFHIYLFHTFILIYHIA